METGFLSSNFPFCEMGATFLCPVSTVRNSRRFQFFDRCQVSGGLDHYWSSSLWVALPRRHREPQVWSGASGLGEEAVGLANNNSKFGVFL